MEIRDRFPGITVTLDQSMNPDRPKKLAKSRTDSLLSSLDTTKDDGQSRLPPAVATVPRDDWKGYVHSKKVNNYLIGATLGEGSFAKVKEAFHVLVGEKVAMKIIDKKKALQDPYVAKNFKREAKLLQKLHHPNIVQLYEVIETENNYYLITELCSGGELMKYIYKCGKLPEEETRKYIRQLVSAVDHLHRAGLIHRDLKVENLLLDDNKDLKLIDFGLSNEEYSYDESGKEIHCQTQCGSPAYAAPELLGQKQYDRSVDIWSIGVNMYAMLTGCLPFTVEPFNITTLHAKMLQNKMNPIPDHLSKNCQDLLKRMLTASPENRITMSEIFEHPWLSEGHLPFQPSPYPNHITQAHINNDIVHHISEILQIGCQADIKQDVLLNKATSLYAAYYLLSSRLKRYEKEYPLRITRQHRRGGSVKKKISRDQGFYEEDDEFSETSSIVSAASKGNTKRLPGGVILRQNPNPSNRRPVSEDFTETVPHFNPRRRLSDIVEERRASVPSELMRKDIEKIQKKAANPPATSQSQRPRDPVRKPGNHILTRHSHPQGNYSIPPAHINNMSPPVDPYEFDMNHSLHHHQNTVDVGKSSSMPHELNRKAVPNNAWNSNPPSRASSRASLYNKLPSLSMPTDEADDDCLEFHDISDPITPTSRRTTFFVESPTPYHDNNEHTVSSSSPKVSSGPRKRATSFKRRNGISIPPTGDFTLKTDLPVGALLSELLRVAQSMNMKVAEPTSPAKLHCNHKTVELDITVRKKSLTNCCLHFEWLSGGSYKIFTEVCQEILQKAHV